MSTPDNTPQPQQPDNAPTVETSKQDVTTNAAESDKIVNQDSVVADMDGITETLSEGDATTELNADNTITDHGASTGDPSEEVI